MAATALTAYSTGGVQWGMPFNVSNPVLYYTRSMFAAAGLDPDDPPTTLEELREYSQAIVDSGAASYGIALDTGSDSGGGWFLEQWFANAGEFYADNGMSVAVPENGRFTEGVDSHFFHMGAIYNGNFATPREDFIAAFRQPSMYFRLYLSFSHG